MALFDLIIFDCDGVLVDSELIANEVLAEILIGHGMAISATEARSIFIGQSVDEIRITAESYSGVFIPENWSIRYYEALLPALAERVRAVNGVEDIIELLRAAGVPFCVASQGPLEKIRTTLTAAGLWEAFSDRAYSSKSVARPKPAPDLFLHAAYACNSAPERCAVVEDSAPGVKAGVAAGMTVFAYCSVQDIPMMQDLGATTFTDMAELPIKRGLL